MTLTEAVALVATGRPLPPKREPMPDTRGPLLKELTRKMKAAGVRPAFKVAA